jgi:hypothetical protein
MISVWHINMKKIKKKKKKKKGDCETNHWHI